MTEQWIKISGGFTIMAKVKDDGKAKYDEETITKIICRTIGGKLSNSESIELRWNCEDVDKNIY